MKRPLNLGEIFRQDLFFPLDFPEAAMYVVSTRLQVIDNERILIYLIYLQMKRGWGGVCRPPLGPRTPQVRIRLISCYPSLSGSLGVWIFTCRWTNPQGCFSAHLNINQNDGWYSGTEWPGDSVELKPGRAVAIAFLESKKNGQD